MCKQLEDLPLVSVVIPLYNKSMYVERALRSVLLQTFQDFEIIVVDDGSTDGSAEIVRRLHDPRITLILQENKGPGAARNAGTYCARAELVAFLDADDEWMPTYLEKGVARLAILPESVATFSQGYLRCRRTGETPRSTRPMWEQRGLVDGVYELTSDSDPQLAVYLLAYLSPCSTIARKRVVLEYGGFYDADRRLYGEDAFLWLKVLLNEKVAISLEPRVVYHSEASTLTKTISSPRALEPFLENPSAIESVCPQDKRELLRKILALRALNTAEHYILHGRGDIARDLLRRFSVPGYMPQRASKLRICSWVAPVFPKLRALYRLVKRRFLVK